MSGWSTTHSTSYHAVWTVDPSYNLERMCPTHKLVLARKSTASHTRPTSSSHTSTAPAATADTPVTNTAVIMNILNSFEDNVTTAKEQALIKLVKAALHLN